MFHVASYGSLLALGCIVVLSGCGGGPVVCAENVTGGASLYCSCEKGGRCEFDACGAGKMACALECNDGAACEGDCGPQCGYHCRTGAACHASIGALSEITCSADSSCTLSVGDNAKVICENTKRCTVQCTGSCQVACSLANCDVTCAGGSAPTGTGTEIVCGNPA